jgi:hypothetical protein
MIPLAPSFPLQPHAYTCTNSTIYITVIDCCVLHMLRTFCYCYCHIKISYAYAEAAASCDRYGIVKTPNEIKSRKVIVKHF